jgi:hypothetical protein
MSTDYFIGSSILEYKLGFEVMETCWNLHVIAQKLGIDHFQLSSEAEPSVDEESLAEASPFAATTGP